jgi:hypothetical protein
MIEQSSRRFIGLLTILLMITTPLTILPHQAHATSQTGVMIALYTYPDSTWTAVAQAKLAHPSVPVVAIINPNNGPGSSRDANYVSGIQELHNAGVVVLGYDATGYASNSASSVKSLMNTWKSLYTIDGIFFDEMANWSGPESYYSDLTSYAKSLGYTMTVGNPGTDTIPSYIGTVDNLMIYENPGLPALSALQGWHTSYDKSNFSMIAFGVNSLSQSFITSASSNVGYLYITNDVLPNPYDTVPSYFATEVADLDTGSTATAPQAPTGLGATAISSSQINLSWTAANNGGSAITGYKIARSTDAGTTWSVLVANTASSSTTYSNTGLAASTAYMYRVSAINTVGTSPVSNTASATTIAVATAPQAPTGLTASTISSSQINLSWVAPSNGGSAITGYKIDRSTDNGSTWSTLVANTASSSTTYSNTGLVASTAYTYRVSAINSVGTSSASSTASATTSGTVITVPQPPTGLASSVVSSSQINLSWVAPANNGGSVITGYKIERSANAGTTWGTVSANTSSVSITYSDTGLAASTSYMYRVSAINSVGTSSASNTTSATTTAVATAPQAPTGLGTTAISSSQINLSWTASNNGGSAITGYKIDRSTDAGTTWSTIIANTASTSTTYSNTGLAASTSYMYRVSAINAIGTSPVSNTASATTSAVSSGGTVSITVNSVNLAGVSFSGMWVELHASNGTTLATGYTPITFNVASGNAYTIVSSNYQNDVFNHWNDGTTTTSKTITPTQNTTLTEYYSTGPVSLKVKSVNLAGTVITGLWTTLVSGGATIQSGYTTMTYTVTPGNQYTVTVSNYQNYVFSHWSDGSTNPNRIITPTQATTLVAYYNS